MRRARVLEGLVEGLGLSRLEAEAYLLLVERAGMTGRMIQRTMKMDEGQSTILLESMERKGLVIREGTGAKYLALHPRLALGNLYNILQEEFVRRIREKRRVTDALVLELTPVFEKNSHPVTK